MKKREFNQIMNSLKSTIANYEYYVDFSKIYQHIDKYSQELNILNSLIGSKNIEEDFLKVIKEYPQTIPVIPLLLATRSSKIEILDEQIKEYNFNLKKEINYDDYLVFMRKTGWFNLLENKKITNLLDYMTGIEVGMDTNARKNRTGKLMEKIVENYIQLANPIEYFPQMKKKDIATRYHLDIDQLLLEKDNIHEAEKRFDFVVKSQNDLFLIEVNFFNGGGSKLNETARSFKSLNQSIKKLNGVTFIWITDGIGWTSAKNNLREAYDEIEHLYTLTDLENGVLNELFNPPKK